MTHADIYDLIYSLTGMRSQNGSKISHEHIQWHSLKGVTNRRPDESFFNFFLLVYFRKVLQ